MKGKGKGKTAAPIAKADSDEDEEEAAEEEESEAEASEGEGSAFPTFAGLDEEDLNEEDDDHDANGNFDGTSLTSGVFSVGCSRKFQTRSCPNGKRLI